MRLFFKVSRPSISHGNRVSVVKSGNYAFETLLNLIYNAKEYILFEYYIFRDDDCGKVIADALIEKSRQGVKVYLIYDYIGCLDVSADFFKNMESNGVNVIAFNPLKLFTNPLKWDRRDHKKLAIFDGHRAIVSGWNIGAEYFKSGEDAMRDIGLIVEGPVVKILERIFIKVYEKQKKEKIKLTKIEKSFVSGEDEVWVIESGPSLRVMPVYNAYRLAVMAAKKSVWIANAYFVPPRKFRKSLANAVKKSVDVRILLPDKIDVSLVKYASYNFYSMLLRAGIKIYERTKMILHSKVAVIDDVWVTVGSANLHRRSLEKNYELNLVVTSERLGREIRAIFEEDFADSKKIELEIWQQRPFIEKVKEKFAAIFSFLL